MILARHLSNYLIYIIIDDNTIYIYILINQTRNSKRLVLIAYRDKQTNVLNTPVSVSSDKLEMRYLNITFEEGFKIQICMHTRKHPHSHNTWNNHSVEATCYTF